MKIEIACQQVLLSDSSVFSVQWVDFPSRHKAKLTPEFVQDRYFSYLRRFTLGMVRAVQTDDGVEFRFLSTRLHLLAFSPPVRADKEGAGSITLHICGGPFVQRKRCDRGAFSFITEQIEERIRVTIRLEDYHPRLLGSASPGRLRICLYRFTQAYVHRVVTVRFLASLFREVEGKLDRFSIVPVQIKEGADI